MSAYEIPGILADTTLNTGNYELSLGSMPKSFYHSRCEQPDFKYADLELCTKMWDGYVQNYLNGSQTMSKWR